MPKKKTSRKKIIKKTTRWAEAVAIKTAIDNLNKKLGKRERAKLKRKGVVFEVWN